MFGVEEVVEEDVVAMPVTLPGGADVAGRGRECPPIGTRSGTNESPRGGSAMSITASEARKHLFPLIEKVNEDHAPVHITSRKGNAVLMSEEDFTSWQETIYLLRSPANARRLLDSVAEAEAGTMEYRELVDLSEGGGEDDA